MKMYMKVTEMKELDYISQILQLYTNLKCIWRHVFIIEIFISERKTKKFQNHNLLQIIKSLLSVRNVDQFLLFLLSSL